MRKIPPENIPPMMGVAKTLGVGEPLKYDSLSINEIDEATASRSAFEKWALENGQVRGVRDFKRDPADPEDYEDREVSGMWFTWQAALRLVPKKAEREN